MLCSCSVHDTRTVRDRATEARGLKPGAEKTISCVTCVLSPYACGHMCFEMIQGTVQIHPQLNEEHNSLLLCRIGDDIRALPRCVRCRFFLPASHLSSNFPAMRGKSTTHTANCQRDCHPICYYESLKIGLDGPAPVVGFIAAAVLLLCFSCFPLLKVPIPREPGRVDGQGDMAWYGTDRQEALLDILSIVFGPWYMWLASQEPSPQSVHIAQTQPSESNALRIATRRLRTVVYS